MAKIHSFEALGDIALLKLKPEERKNAKKIAKAIMEQNPRIKSVFEKVGKVKGRYRVRSLRLILGERKYLAVYKENGCTFVFDIRRVYFSSRLSFERMRIVNQVLPGENVLVLFAGVGPYAIEIAKFKKANVTAIELNKWACYYMKKNAQINKVDINIVEGDVKKKIKPFKNYADRIVAPLPKSTYKFLDEILYAAKNKCVVHYYAFVKKNKIDQEKKKIEDAGKKNRCKINFLNERVVRGYSPKEDIVVIDFEVNK